MFEFDFKRSSRRCAITGKEFDVGEKYVSVLIDNDGEWVRQDISMAEWSGPPDNCIGWWQSRVRDVSKGKIYWAPRDVLISFFEKLIEQADAPDKTYLMAILLMQKKYLKLLDTSATPQGEVMELVDTTGQQRFEVQVCDLEPVRIHTIQTEFAEKLFTDVEASED